MASFVNLLFPYIKSYGKLIIFYVILSFLAKLLGISLPYFTGSYIDSLVEHIDINSIKVFSILLLILGLGNILANCVQSYIFVKLKTHISNDLKLFILKHISFIPISNLESKEPGYINHRINSDVNVIVAFILGNSFNVVINLLNIVLLLVICFRINDMLTIIILPLIPIYIMSYFFFKDKIYTLNYDMKEKENDAFSKTQHFLENMKSIKIKGAFEEYNEYIDKKLSNVLTSLLKYTRTSLQFASNKTLIKVVVQVILFYYGGKEIISGNLKIGQFTIMSNYFIMILDNLGFLYSVGEQYQNAKVSMDRILDILSINPEKNGSVLLENIENIELNNISFGYKGSNSEIKKFSYVFNRGNIYCIAGENGVGKSTLINLILGIYVEEFSGTILYNSLDIKKIDLYSTRSELIGVSEQEPKLTYMPSGTGKEHFKEELGVLLTALNVNKNLFDCEDTVMNVSGGEKLKISLIRALLKKPKILILDEPTSALDTVSIAKLKKILLDSKNDRITIIITHDEGFKDIADEIIEIKAM
ncbi:ABC transporter ATP-binding protein [Alkalicella caledoniensis]|uniref:ABC transporter ATP-binding protein n=1 Tax=Alkalicella caledoniensis TaxID=2731377 RepID=A0A7G9W590_ALKCA|nr:ABC transporter ATP-binding protein [Alkalicella caledoniensis]QNO13852.1 ABC transporter ATP-binding protein [Alkalicella caledoniensis]